MSLALHGSRLVRPWLRLMKVDTLPKVAAIHTTQISTKGDDRRTMLKSIPKKDEGTQGMDGLGVEYHATKACTFPDLNTRNEVFNGVPFSQLPIVHIKTSPNNTIFCASDYTGKPILHRSCGMEGFKHCRKGTNVAAQTTAMSLAQKLAKLGVTSARICVQGLGPGRLSSLKGLVMGGLEVISITDTTPFCDNPPRPRGAKSL